MLTFVHVLVGATGEKSVCVSLVSVISKSSVSVDASVLTLELKSSVRVYLHTPVKTSLLSTSAIKFTDD